MSARARSGELVSLEAARTRADERRDAEARASEGLRRCARGDMTALGELFDLYARDLTRVVAKLLGPTDADVDDLVQRAFLAAFTAAPHFDGSRSARAWLIGVAVNVVRNERRARARRSRLAGAFGWARPTDEDPRQALECRSELRQLDACLRRLSEPLREVFVLSQLEHLPATAVAEALDVPVGTVHRRLHDARAKLLELRGVDA